MSKNLYWGFAALIILLIAIGGFIYYQWLEIVQLKEQVAQTLPGASQGRHYEPIVSEGEMPQDVVNIPDYIYQPNRERPAGWDPQLVFEIGDKKIDLNYHPQEVISIHMWHAHMAF